MRLSTEKILTTHAGSMPRGEPLSSMLIDQEEGKRIDIKVPTKFGNMRRIMDVLDKTKTVLLSMMTIPAEEESEWLIMLRLKTDNAEPIAKELKSAGFTVTYTS